MIEENVLINLSKEVEDLKNTNKQLFALFRDLFVEEGVHYDKSKFLLNKVEKLLSRPEDFKLNDEPFNV